MIKIPKQHNSKAVKKMMRKLEVEGFTITRKKSGTYRIDPPEDSEEQSAYMTHGTESSLHQIRRDFKRIYDIDLGNVA